MVHVRMGLFWDIKIFKKLNFVSVVQCQKTCLRDFQGVQLSMQWVFVQNFEHSRVPNFYIFRCSHHVPFVESNFSNGWANKQLDAWDSVTWSPPFNNALWTSQSNNRIGSVLPHDSVWIFGYVIGNDLTGCCIIVFELSLIIRCEQKVIRKVLKPQRFVKFVKFNASVIINESMRNLWKCIHLIIV